MKTRYFIGHGQGKRVLFSADFIPTPTTHPEFNAVVGPFKTKRAAKFMLLHGNNNPHLQTVLDAERVSKV